MNPIRINLEQLKNKTIPIGREGENEYTIVRIDCGKVFREHPQAEVSMRVKPPKGIVYPVTVEREGNEIIWTVKDYDLASKGDGQFQLTFTDGTVICKTAIGRTLVLKSLVGDGPAPTPIEDWMEEAQEALDSLEDAEVNQPMIGEDGYWYTWNQEAGEYQKTETKAEGQDGDPGFSPSASVSKSGKTTTITITDQSGTTTAQVLDGSGVEIDDTVPAADKVFSSAKVDEELGGVKNAITAMNPAATASDIGKALSPKIVNNGKVTEWQFVEGGGGSVDPQDIAQAVEEWCDENITSDPTVVIDKSLMVEGAAADAKETGKVRDIVLEEIDVDLKEKAVTGNLRITASNGATTDNTNWNSFLLDIDDIDDNFHAKLYSSSTAYAVLAFYSSKETISSSTCVGTPITVSASNTYKEITKNDLTIPSTAVCAVCVYNKSGTESFIKSKKESVKVYTKQETNEQIEEALKNESPASFLLNVDADNIFTSGAYNVVNGVATLVSADSWYSKEVNVAEGDKYTVTSTIYGSTYYAVLLVDNNYNVISAIEKHNADSYKTVVVPFIIPSGATKLIVNSKEAGTTANLMPSNIRIQKTPNKGIGGRFTILAANCNGFPDGESSFYPLTTAEYKAHWRNLLNDNKIDFMAISEYNHGNATGQPAYFGGEYVDVALFADSMPFFKFITNGVGQATACRLAGTHYINRISVTDTIEYDGETYDTSDKFVMKTEVIVNGTPVVIYSIKLCPSGADPTPTKLAWTKAMRQAQYQDILDDIAAYGYTHYIICGDFNAQNCSQDNEYQIFLDAGLTICNGGYLGWKSTLRNINADNIIFPNTIRLVQFKVLDDYVLNTDHYPIMAELQINPTL